MKVLLVDDNETFLIGLKNLLEADEIEVVGTANSAASALAMTRYLRPDVVLMDVMMPGRSGIEATGLIKQQFPSIKIVMMTLSESDAHLFESLKQGATGYLMKSMAMDQFPRALKAMSKGEAALSRSLVPKVLQQFTAISRVKDDDSDAKKALNSQLTFRQKVLLKNIARGVTYQEIAAQMNLSERTIKYEVRAIADSLNLENRAQVLAYASKYIEDLSQQTS